jgi:hypothetical protein
MRVLISYSVHVLDPARCGPVRKMTMSQCAGLRPGKRANTTNSETRTEVDEDQSLQFAMRRAPVIVLDNGASTIKVGVSTSPKDVR